MAEILTSATVEAVLKRVIYLITSTIRSKLGLSEDLQRLREHATWILVLLRDAANNGMRLDEKWLLMLQDLAYDADDVLDELSYEDRHRKLQIGKPMKSKMLIPHLLAPKPVDFYANAVQKVRAINCKLDDIVSDSEELEHIIVRVSDVYKTRDDAQWIWEDQEMDSDHGKPPVVGRDGEVEYIVKILTKQTHELGPIFPIVGTGGIGKTTLARVIYNHQEIERHFDKRIWVSASGNFEATRLLKLILEELVIEPVGNTNDEIFLKLQKELRGRRCLLVLDNVNEGSIYDEWEDFLDKFFMVNPELDSWLLVTTRSLDTESFERHALHPKCLDLEPLADDDCWSIFKDYVFGIEVSQESDILSVFTGDILRVCGGVPLAAKLLGSMLRNEAEPEWPLVLLHLPVARGDVNQVMKLIFNQLPSSSVRNCFAYCSIFPKDFYIERHQLVQLWRAEGCIQPHKGASSMVLEDTGYLFFNILVQHSLLQDIKKDEYGNITHCRLHDLVHDFAQELSNHVNFNSEDFTRCKLPPVRYLALDSFGGRTYTIRISEARIVRTLFLKSNISDSQLLDLRFLRTLKLSSADIESLPSLIGKLIHLRYLCLSGTSIKFLPDSICKLHNLQTLNLNGCPFLKELPKDIASLISLRHLYLYKNEEFCMSPKMGQMTSLQTLLFFNLDKEKGHQIDEIGHLKNLKGKIVIRKLELVRGEEEAQLADLFGKTGVYKLEYQWNDNGKCSDNHEKVLEGLQPHPEIKSLAIRNYNGDKLPSWVLQMAVSVNNRGGSLNKLVEVRLINCKSCRLVPMLWQLPFLQYLELKGLTKVTSICSSCFFGSNRSSLYNRKTGRPTMFPALKRLQLDSMPNLERWTETDDETPRTEMFACLENLSIQHCPRLTTTHHHFPSLKELNINNTFVIYNNIELANMCHSVTTLRELQIYGLSELTCLPEVLLHRNLNLEVLRISSCPNLTHVVPTLCDSITSLRELSVHVCAKLSELPEGLNNMSCLEILCVEECPKLKCFPYLIEDKQLTLLRHLKIAYCDSLTRFPHRLIESCTNLRSLRISHCPNLIFIPLDLDHFTSLSFLWISDCFQCTGVPERLGNLYCLSELRFGHFSNSVQFDSIRACLNGLQNLPTLHSLGLYGQQEWTSLPDELQHLSGLRVLNINDFGIEALPDWLEELPYLEELGLYSCKKLKYMPSAVSMKQFTELRRLSIFGCPLVRKSYMQSGWYTPMFELNTDWA